MTLADFFSYVAANPWPFAFYFLAFPLLVWIVGKVAQGSRDVTFWSYVYAALVYAICIPGIFAVMLNIYLFLFERQSIWQANLILQVIPVVSMAISLMLVKKSVPFRHIPGFGKLSGFMTLIAALIGILWFVDRLKLVAFTYVPFSYIVAGFVLMLLLIRFAWSKLF